MTINSKQNLVIIKDEDKTDEIRHISLNNERTVVTYKSGKSYPYFRSNVEFFSNPESIPVDNCCIFIEGDLLSDVDSVLRFGHWVKIYHGTGSSRCCRFSEFSIQRMTTPEGRSKDVLAYLRELAECVSLRTDEGSSLLAMKYRHLDIISQESILFSFLREKPSIRDSSSSVVDLRLILPFGCNMSQKMALEKALRYPVSIIQGPPGTGKTQTILNLIGNMLLEGKKVAVVSSNNSATANVLEKLKKYELDFVAAFLGSAKNKTAFIEGQTDTLVQLPIIPIGQTAAVYNKIRSLNQEIDKGFKLKNELSGVIQKIDALKLELTHFEKFRQEFDGRNLSIRDRAFQPKTPTQDLMKYWMAYERKAKRQYTKNQRQSPGTAGATGCRTGILQKLLLVLRFGMAGRVLFDLGIEERIAILQKAYYLRTIEDLENRRTKLEVSLKDFRFNESLELLTALSMRLLKHRLAKHYNNKTRRIFALQDLWRQPEDFLDEYPLILSTTFSVITSVRNGYMFDCVIVDEASQVDLLNGVLAMGCAKKLVIVGDPMQLPNVLSEQDKEKAIQVVQRYDVPHYARYEEHNLLSAVRSAFSEIPETLLREHYRCHPKIIQFCNQQFYGGELLIMTSDQGESDVIKVYMTVKGRHARGTFNQRQIDEIIENVLPELGTINSSDIGIVSPYREQTARIRATIGSEEIEVDTVHKYQGREKRIMIITTVSNEANDFVDNPNLLNVAISRAQEKLRLVVSKEMTEGNGNIADFVRYIQYSNGDVIPGRVRSVFDLLYTEYTAARKDAFRKLKRISKYDSENLAYAEIEAVLNEGPYKGYGILFQFPLWMLVRDTGHLSPEESAYASHPWTRTDFLIYRKVDKSPVLVIEVDGFAFHRKGTRQAQRDALKDSVLKKSGLPVLRLSTTGSSERSRIRKDLQKVILAKAPSTT